MIICIWHSAGLLTRRQLSSGPEFGITTKPCNDLDAFHLVFGAVIGGFEVFTHCAKDKFNFHE
jgi:cyclophilin family peptidyl-prolyl cis-trans isomerase